MKSKILEVWNFPVTGVVFRDITPLLNSRLHFKTLTARMSSDQDFEYVAGIDARGFILGAAVASRIGAGFVPIRKSGKLPRKVWSAEYDLEYGKAILDVHKDSIEPEAKVLVVDDVLATGGTALAAVKLMRMCGGIVSKAVFAIEIKELEGRKKLEDEGVEVESIFKF